MDRAVSTGVMRKRAFKIRKKCQLDGRTSSQSTSRQPAELESWLQVRVEEGDEVVQVLQTPFSPV